MPDDLYDPVYDGIDLPPELGDELRDKIITLTEFKTQLDHTTAPRDLDWRILGVVATPDGLCDCQ